MNSSNISVPRYGSARVALLTTVAFGLLAPVFLFQPLSLFGQDAAHVQASTAAPAANRVGEIDGNPSTAPSLPAPSSGDADQQGKPSEQVDQASQEAPLHNEAGEETQVAELSTSPDLPEPVAVAVTTAPHESIVNDDPATDAERIDLSGFIPTIRIMDVSGRLSECEKQLFVDRIHGLLDTGWNCPPKVARKNAMHCFRSAQRFCSDDPRLYHAYGLVLRKQMLPAVALEQFEKAVQVQNRAKMGNRRLAYFAPWRQMIQLQILKRRYEKAALDCVSLIRVASRIEPLGSPGWSEGENILAENVAWVGQVFGYLQGPAHTKTRNKVAFGPLEAQIQQKLSEGHRQLFQQAKEAVFTKYEEELGYADSVHAMREELETQKRKSGERAKKEVQANRNGVLGRRMDSWSDNGWLYGYYHAPSRFRRFAGPRWKRVRKHHWNGQQFDTHSSRTRTFYETPRKARVRRPYVLATYIPTSQESERQALLATFPEKYIASYCVSDGICRFSR